VDRVGGLSRSLAVPRCVDALPRRGRANRTRDRRKSEAAVIGVQKMHLVADDVAFSVTASTHRPDKVLEHQRRFLRHTSLRALQWINLNHSHIELRTIERQ